MPDEYGRWTLEDGMRIAQLGMQLGGNIRATEAAEREKITFEQAQKERLQYDQYAALEQKGQDPEKTLPATEINHRVLAKVKSDRYQAKMADVQYRKAEFDLALAKAQDAKRLFIENISRAEAMETSGNPDMAIPYYIEAYKYINNGDNIQYDPESGKAFQLEPDENGALVRTEEIKLPTKEQMQMMARDILDKNTFEQMYVSNHLKNKSINATAVANPTEIVDSQGNRAGWMAQGVDPATGYPDWKVSLNDGRLISYKEAREKGYQAREGWAKETKEKLGLVKQEAEIAHERALTSKAGKEKASVSTSPEEKLADFYVRAGKAKDAGEALDMIEEAKAKSDKFRLLMEEVKDPLSDVKVGTDLFEQRLKDLKLEMYFPKKPKAGMEAAPEAAETPKVPGARKGKDGNWYKEAKKGDPGAKRAKNGKWYVMVELPKANEPYYRGGKF